jgi:hypothetical protein
MDKVNVHGSLVLSGPRSSPAVRSPSSPRSSPASVEWAAPPHDTLVLVIVAVVAGGTILFPSLALLFGLVLPGRFDSSLSMRITMERDLCSRSDFHTSRLPLALQQAATARRIE